MDAVHGQAGSAMSTRVCRWNGRWPEGLPRLLTVAACLALGAAYGCLAASIPLSALSGTAPPLSFSIPEGSEINQFLREGAIAGHLVLKDGAAPRVLVAFPAGDSGVALWLEGGSQDAAWQVVGKVQPVTGEDTRGRELRGLSAELRLAVPRLRIRQALLSSVRVLRDYEASGVVPPAVRTGAQLRGPSTLVWARDRLDGAAGYQLSLQGLEGTHVSAGLLSAGPDRALHLRLQALTGEPPLRPLGGQALWRPTALADARERDVLSFLSYREKYLAGSWRFDTYFGRDTLLTLTLLAPVLQTDAVAGGIDSVLTRLSAGGEVAHEEAVGEYAVLLNAAAGRGQVATPLYDYGMLDENFLLAPLLARWLLDDRAGAAQATGFLAATIPGETQKRSSAGVAPDRRARGAVLLRNLRFVVRRTAGFARQPDYRQLIGLKAGRRAGDWRDSPDGLDGGTYPYDVNVALVPAALAATARLLDSGLLEPYLQPGDRALLAQAHRQQRVWAARTAPLFQVHVGGRSAAADVTRYAHSLGLPVTPAVAALGTTPLRFAALALDADGRALPVMHSDESFELLFGQPGPERLRQALQALGRPFPAGLMTPAGLLVANPAFADAATQARFSTRAYHGTVVWAWQQALLAAGLARQLARPDLPPSLRQSLRELQGRLWRVIDAARAWRGVELWSWGYRSGQWQPEPFAPGGGEAESDAAQLWSTLFLALKPPPPVPAVP
jgi:hypothetical protein